VQPDTILKYNARVPRYTSYPTAAQFHDGVDARVHADWLAAIPADDVLSLYLHVPFCRSLCWYCGCNMQVVRRDSVMERYTEQMLREIGLVANRLPRRMRVRHVHWGGGTPTAIGPDRLRRIMDALRDRFAFDDDAELAIEIDPRVLDVKTTQMLGRLGFNRASIGIQDLNLEVQQAVNRIQCWGATQTAADRLRTAGIGNINLDLIYGLPHQSEARLLRTIETVLSLDPERIALFGYAHVPWMKPHQKLIDETALADPKARLQHQKAAAECMVARGYQAIGLDHFAKPDSPFAAAAREGRLHRNFQGYTEDTCRTLIGFGASSISDLPDGMVQNAADVRSYQDTIAGGALATRRGVARTAEDAVRAEVIERLMCDFAVDLDRIDARHPGIRLSWDAALDDLAPFEADGLVERAAQRIAITPEGRPIVRAVCALFDRYLDHGKQAHAIAV